VRGDDHGGAAVTPAAGPCVGSITTPPGGGRCLAEPRGVATGAHACPAEGPRRSPEDRRGASWRSFLLASPRSDKHAKFPPAGRAKLVSGCCWVGTRVREVRRSVRSSDQQRHAAPDPVTSSIEERGEEIAVCDPLALDRAARHLAELDLVVAEEGVGLDPEVEEQRTLLRLGIGSDDHRPRDASGEHAPGVLR
jgi:hypothetical protein